MKTSNLWCLSALCVALAGCSSDDNTSASVSSDSDAVIERAPTTSTANVFQDQIAVSQRAATTLPENTVNFLDHPDFEDGFGGWNACETGAISETTDSYSGDSALELEVKNCVYQTVNAIPNQVFDLSCYIKITNDFSWTWTGMGMTASNTNYKELLESPVARVTSSEYAKVATSITVPSDASYLSVWIHSDHGAIIDNCSLTLEEGSEPEPTTYTDNDLLINGDFNDVNVNGRAKNWSTGCDGQASADGTSVSVLNGACIDQTLSTDRIATIADTDSTLSCMIDDIVGYADMGVYLDDKSVNSRKIKESHKGSRLSMNVPAATGDNGFVTFYANETLVISDCTLILDGGDVDTGPITEVPADDNSPAVVFESTQLEALVRTRLNLDDDHTITTNDMLGLTELYDVKGEGKNIKNLVGLEFALNLESMIITNFKVTDLSPLAGLTKLDSLRLDSDNITNLDALANLTALTVLTVVPSSSLTDITGLTTLTKLKTLKIHGGDTLAITDLTPLSGMKKLEFLSLYGTTVADLTPIASLAKLERMFTGGTVENIAALVDGTAFQSGDFFALKTDDNDLSANSPNLAALHALNDRGVTLYLSDSNRAVVELPALATGL